MTYDVLSTENYKLSTKLYSDNKSTTCLTRFQAAMNKVDKYNACRNNTWSHVPM